MVDTLKGLKPGNILIAGDLIVKIAKMGPVQLKGTGPKFSADDCTYELAVVRTCPPGFSGGQLKVDDYGNYKLHKFVEGDYAKYKRLIDRWNVDVTCAAVGEGDWIPTYDIGDFTKLDLIAYVIAVHGPSMRDDIMRRVAALESLPWIPTSNTEYFGNVADTDPSTPYGNPTDSTMCKAGKLGRKQLYGLGTAGKERAKLVIAHMGEGPARAVDGPESEPTKAVPPIRRK